MGRKKTLYPYIIAEMTIHGETREELAEVLEMTKTALCRRLLGDIDWSLSEIRKVCIHYKKPPEELFNIEY